MELADIAAWGAVALKSVGVQVSYRVPLGTKRVSILVGLMLGLESLYWLYLLVKLSSEIHSSRY